MLQATWKALAAATVAAVAGACLAGVELTEDPPVAPAPKAGDVTGTIAPADKVASISAVSRVTGQAYAPQAFDRTTGGFRFAGLPGDATYDVCLRTNDGRRLEGIDLDFVDHRMIRLAELRRKQLGLPAEKPHAFNADDVQEMLKYVRDLKDFCTTRRAIYVRGHGPRATMLVELIRAEDYFARKGDEIIWRIELWYFEYRYGGWDRLANQERILHRTRTPYGQWSQTNVEYFDTLSAHVSPTGYSEAVRFEIPDKPDPSRGRVPGTPPQMDTRPHVLGLDEEPKGPTTTTSRPADPQKKGTGNFSSR